MRLTSEPWRKTKRKESIWNSFFEVLTMLRSNSSHMRVVRSCWIQWTLTVCKFIQLLVLQRLKANFIRFSWEVNESKFCSFTTYLFICRSGWQFNGISPVSERDPWHAFDPATLHFVFQRICADLPDELWENLSRSRLWLHTPKWLARTVPFNVPCTLEFIHC